MKKHWILVCLAAGAFSCVMIDDEIEIAIEDIPANIKQIALDAVPGLQIQSAEIETEDGQKVYEIEGVTAMDEVEIEIAADGSIVEIEKESLDDD